MGISDYKYKELGLAGTAKPVRTYFLFIAELFLDEKEGVFCSSLSLLALTF